jgi:hypothetical protein
MLMPIDEVATSCVQLCRRNTRKASLGTQGCTGSNLIIYHNMDDAIVALKKEGRCVGVGWGIRLVKTGIMR